MNPPPPATLMLRWYRTIAAAYPHEFRNVFGEEMDRAGEDVIEMLWRHHGWIGLARLLFDVAARLPVEYAAEMRQDIRFGLRSLVASPAFTLVALLSLTLGIGVATSAFSEMNGFLLRDTPGISRPDELAAVKAPVAWETYQRFRAHPELFSGMTAYVAPAAFGVAASGPAERVWGHLATASYFATLGVRPALGRFFSDDEAAVAVVSHHLWRERLGGDPLIVGKALRINGRACTVVGVTPKEFHGASPLIYAADLWLPIAGSRDFAPELAGDARESYERRIFHVIGRLAPGVTPARAEAALDAGVRQLDNDHAAPDRDRPGRRAALGAGGKLMPLEKKDLPLMTGFFAILGGVILLIATSNIANMTLARAAGRRKEIALRLALGAGRARLIRQLLVESLLLAAAACALGLLLAEWLMRLASGIRLPYPMPLRFDLTPDVHVLVFCIVLTSCTGLAFGLVPALQATRSDLTPALKEGGALLLPRRRRLSLRNALMISQVAASLSLLLITGFLVVGHRKIGEIRVGFDPSRLTLVSLDPIRDGYSPERTRELFSQILDRVKWLPAVTAASISDDVPMTMIGRPFVPFTAQGPLRTIQSARRYAVSKEFFETMGIPILRGRPFHESDETGDSLAVIVSEKLARQVWPQQDPLGQHIEIGVEDVPTFELAGARAAARRTMSGTRRLEVVGVARDIQDGLARSVADSPALMYMPLAAPDYARPSSRGMTLLVRGAPGVDAPTAVRREIAATDSRLTVFGVHALTDDIDTIVAAVRGALWTYGCIGLFGLILASVGLAGLTAYSVAQRRREIGIRIAIGARGRDVVRLVMNEGLALVAIGSVLGLIGARAGIRALGAIMSEIARTAGTSTSDPLLLAGAPLLLAAVALLSCYLPARASTRIDPVEALRQE
jgi:macrolide transport system ATP-binding/permease protein